MPPRNDENNAMQLLEHFRELTLHPENTEELKSLILQLAVQGKLTQKWREENPDVEPASVLLERIKAEKEKLIKQKKITKGEQLPEISEDEVQFDLPENWKWCRFDDIGIPQPGFSFKSQFFNQDGRGVPLIRIRDLHKESIETFYSGDYREEFIVNDGEYLVGMDGNFNIAKWKKGKALLNQRVCRLFFISNELVKDVFIHALQFELWKLQGTKSYTTVDHLSGGQIKTSIIPLPPLAEQKAIVEVVNQLFAELEQLESLTKERIQLKEDFVTSALNQLTKAAESEVANHWELVKSQFGTFFTEKSSIKKLREAILQLAVQGKLTHHWRSLRQAEGPKVEHASLLLEKIKAEKEKLVKAGKIKKEKPLPPITDEEIPYDLPEGWVWCRFQEIFDIRDGTHDSPKDAFGKDTFPLITSKNFKSGVIDFESARRISKEDYLKVIQRSQVHKGDILFSMIGGNIGNQLEVGDFTEYAIKNVALFKHYKYGLPKEGFLNLFSKYIALSLQEEAAGGAQPFVSLKYFRNLVLGLPPEQEQKAIIEKVNGLMALCDQLEQEIETHHTTQELWMQSCLREVVQVESTEEPFLPMAAEPRERYGKE